MLIVDEMDQFIGLLHFPSNVYIPRNEEGTNIWTGTLNGIFLGNLSRRFVSGGGDNDNAMFFIWCIKASGRMVKGPAGVGGVLWDGQGVVMFVLSKKVG